MSPHNEIFPGCRLITLDPFYHVVQSCRFIETWWESQLCGADMLRPGLFFEGSVSCMSDRNFVKWSWHPQEGVHKGLLPSLS